MSLSHAFKGSDPQDAMISKIMMPGAEYGRANGLTETDRALLAAFLRVMEMLKIPVSQELAPFSSYENDNQDLAPVDIVNKLPEFGGRDFFLEQGHPDAVLLCNIPAYPHVDESDWGQGENSFLEDQRELLRTAFTVSDYHHDEDDWYNWRTKMAELNPKFILLSGIDSFSPDIFTREGYVHIQGPGVAQGLFVSKEYLSEVGAYLLLSDSPLFPCTLKDHNRYQLNVVRSDSGINNENYHMPKAPAIRLDAA